MIFDKFQHGRVGNFVDVERQRPHGDSHHRFGMIEELDGFGVKREIVGVLVVEKVNRVLVEFERESFQEGDVISQHFLVGKIEFVHNDGIDVVVAEQVVKRRFVADILEENIQGLQKLHAHELRALLLHVMQEKL